jgi:cellobiose phosphorylase
MYRAGLESLLGFRLRGTQLLIDPCIPRAWPGFEVTFQYRSARYDLVVENPRGVARSVVGRGRRSRDRERFRHHARGRPDDASRPGRPRLSSR